MNSTRSANKFLLFYVIYSIFTNFIISFINIVIPINKVWLMAMQDIILILIPLIIYFMVTKKRFTDVAPLNRIGFLNIVLILLMTILSTPIISLVSALSTLFVNNTTNTMIVGYLNSMPLIYSVVVFAIFPSVFEEILCRGVFVSNYRTKGFKMMYIIGGLFFGIVHFNLQQFGYAFVAGMLFSFFVHQTNSILAPILAHFFINASQIFPIYLLKYLTAEADILAENPEVNSGYILSLLIMVVIVTPLFWLCAKAFMHINRTRAEMYMNTGINEDGKMVDKYFVVAVVLFLSYTMFLEILLNYV